MKCEKDACLVTGEALYRNFLAGDRDAFDALVVLYEAELSAFINRMVCDYHESKHLTIEAFAQLAVGGWKYAGKSSLKVYLFTIGKNLALRHMKKRGREQHIPLEYVIEILADRDDGPAHYLEKEENKRRLHEAMQGLKDEHRAVLLLLYFEDMSYIAAGRVMKKSVKQIGDLAYRAKAALKKKLESDGYLYR